MGTSRAAAFPSVSGTLAVLTHSKHVVLLIKVNGLNSYSYQNEA